MTVRIMCLIQTVILAVSMFFGVTAGVSAQEVPVPFLSPPLKDQTPYTMQINAVADHSYDPLKNLGYCSDGSVVTFTGEKGSREFGVSTSAIPMTCRIDGKRNDLYGFAKANKKKFLVNGNYTKAWESILEYDGHPGYDYKAKFEDVFSAANGRVVCVSLRVVDGANGDNVGVVVEKDGKTTLSINQCTEGNRAGEIKIDHENGYFTVYIHMSLATVKAGDRVYSGQKIGVSGSTATCSVDANGVKHCAPHLHFEVRKNMGGILVHVDPYGWQATDSPIGPPGDPYTVTKNYHLWVHEIPSDQIAKQEMMNLASLLDFLGYQKSGLADPSTFDKNASITGVNDFDIRTMKFFANGSTNPVMAYHLAYKADPYIRYTWLPAYNGVVPMRYLAQDDPNQQAIQDIVRVADKYGIRKNKGFDIFGGFPMQIEKTGSWAIRFLMLSPITDKGRSGPQGDFLFFAHATHTSNPQIRYVSYGKEGLFNWERP